MARLLTIEEFRAEPGGTFFAPVHWGAHYFADGKPWAERDIDEEEHPEHGPGRGGEVMVKAPAHWAEDGTSVYMPTVSLSPTLWAAGDAGCVRTPSPRPAEVGFEATSFECSILVFSREEVAAPWLALLDAPLSALGGCGPVASSRLDPADVARVMEWRRARFLEARASAEGKLAGRSEAETAATRTGLTLTKAESLALRSGMRHPGDAIRFRLWRDLMGHPSLGRIARMLGKGKSTVCRYIAGDARIPPRVVRRCRELLDARALSMAKRGDIAGRFPHLHDLADGPAARSYVREFAMVAVASPPVGEEIIEASRQARPGCSWLREMMAEAMPSPESAPFPPGCNELGDDAWSR
ncbi:hypothetical protein [Azospirillum sp. TSO5]|uniref:hypothetical protein n=1 Tax=Azospirillum sp. TSO5 TaxID=716760 RepID=UPI000D6549B9|nr:hypothetical protein [Azospirillum sp. TSO5]